MGTKAMTVRTLRVGIAMLGLVVFAACGGDTPTPSGSETTPSVPGTTTQSPAPGASASDTLTGAWSGAYASTSSPGSNGTFTIQFTQSGSQLSGTINIQGSPCITTGTIIGTLNGGQITFGAVEGEQTIQYTGSVSGNTMSGTYSAPQCGNATGTWTASKTG
jgi:hypothetical protein